MGFAKKSLFSDSPLPVRCTRARMRKDCISAGLPDCPTQDLDVISSNTTSCLDLQLCQSLPGLMLRTLCPALVG